jgi:GNAT superfamily N-acetyltransferase
MIVTQNPALDRLIAFEKESWPVEEQAPVELLRMRSETFGQGIFLLADDKGNDVAQFSSGPKRYAVENIETYDQMADMPFDLSSKVMWGLNLAVRPGHQGKGYANHVIAPAFEWMAANGFRSWAAGVTCYGLAKLVKKGEVVDALDYMHQGKNPALRAFKAVCAQKCWAFQSLEPTPGYWEIDEGSLGYGVIIQVVF